MIQRIRPCSNQPCGRRGVALMLALAILAISIALVYAISRSSATQFKGSVHEGASVRAGFAAEMAAAIALEKLGNDPSWLPESNPIVGTLASGEPYQLDVQVIDGGLGLRITAKAQVLASADKKTIADQLLTIRLTKQRLDNFPTSAITAFAEDNGIADVPAVYVADDSTIVGDIKSNGRVKLQTNFKWTHQAKKPRNLARRGTGSNGYGRYRAGWGTSYTADTLSRYGSMTGSQLTLSNVKLGPTATNPMGVYIHTGDLILGDNVSITGTLVVTGRLSISGTSVDLFARTAATDPASGKVVQTSFPSIVADDSITFQPTADAVRISGLIVSGGDVVRLIEKPGNGLALGWANAPGILKKLTDRHDHKKKSTTTTADLFKTTDGPAIYIKGAIMANRVTLLSDASLPFALEFDAATTDTTDAPGFFTWKATEWTEGN